MESIHADVWKRFVQPNGLLLDYSLPDGSVDLPTPAEAQAGRPNALSWWTPVENGAFFTGLYLDAAVLRWEKSRAPADRDKTRKLADGLLLCASVSDVPGFIARNVLPDGHSHYALGSDDQTAPWFYGLWRYVDSGAARPEDARAVVSAMTRVATAIDGARWTLPADRVGAMRAVERRGSFAHPEHRAAVRRLFILRAMYAMTRDATWLARYRETLAGRLGDTPTRELVQRGIEGDMDKSPEMRQQQLWVFVGTQAALAELARLEDDRAVREMYERTLERNARHVLPAATPDAVPAPLDTAAASWPDWRSMNAAWREQATGDEAQKLALEQLGKWNNRARVREIATVREPLSALAIVFYAHPRGQGPESARRALDGLIQTVKWSDLRSSFGFFAELAWFRAAR